jgi:arabinan endo-1,5-alpha-L-arabinosidase
MDATADRSATQPETGSTLADAAASDVRDPDGASSTEGGTPGADGATSTEGGTPVEGSSRASVDSSTSDGSDDRDTMSDVGSVVSPPTGNVTCGTAYTNPITALAHDPSVVVLGDTYFVYSTCQTVAGCNSVPKLIPFQTSANMLNWQIAANALSAVPAWANQLGLTGPTDIWAPDVHVSNGVAYLYYSVSAWGDVTHSAIGFMTNTTLAPGASGYQWVDHGEVIGAPQGGAEVNIIDPDLFIDDDGRWWLVYGSFNGGVRLIELDPATGQAKKPVAPTALTSGLGEGSGIIKNDGYYYLFLSTGLCCSGLNSTYQIVYGRATAVTGPYLNQSGGSINDSSVRLLPPGSDGNPGQGGQSFFKQNNQFYMAYHAYQPPTGDPTLNIRPIYFDANDWVTLDPCKAKGYQP